MPLCLPRLVENRTLSRGIVLDDLAVVLSMCVNEFRVKDETQYFAMCVHV